MVKPRENRIPVMMSDEELKAVEDWRFANRISTRSEAIRRLIQIGARLDIWVETLNQDIVKLFTKSAPIIEEYERLRDADKSAEEQLEVLTPAFDLLMNELSMIALESTRISIVFKHLVEGSNTVDAIKSSNQKYQEMNGRMLDFFNKYINEDDVSD